MKPTRPELSKAKAAPLPAHQRARVRVPLGDARARLRGEPRGGWRTVTRRVSRCTGTLGQRCGEILWRGFPYPVREWGAGRWVLELFGPPTARRERVRIPPIGQRPARTAVLLCFPVRHRVGVRRALAGYVLYGGRLHAVQARSRGRGLELMRAVL